MCWNAEVSLNTFLFALFGTAFGYFNGYNRKELLFFFLFSFMQFVEYMLWSNLDNKKINRLWSIIGFIIIILEPYASINILDSSKLKTVLFVIYSISALVIIFFFKYEFITVVGKNGHLQWKWLFGLNSLFKIFICTVWYFALFIPLIVRTIKNKYNLLPLIFVIGITILTFYNYTTDKTFGTMWCWLSNIVWFYVIYSGISKMVCK